MVKQTLNILVVFILLGINTLKLQAQVISPPEDAIYVKENSPSPTEAIKIDLEHPYYVIDELNHSGWRYEAHPQLDFAEYLKNVLEEDKTKDSLTSKQIDFVKHILYYRQWYKSAPVVFNDCVFFNPAFTGADYIISHHSGNYLPEAYRFYATPFGDTVLDNDYRLKLKLSKPLYKMMQPFYFKKTAITNKEYREFVQWVKDSLAHLALAENDPTMVIVNDGRDIDPLLINWKAKINYGDTLVMKTLVNAGLYKLPVERFYIKPEIDSRVLNYMYYTLDTIDSTKKSTYSRVLKKPNRKSILTKRVVNVYPDTLAWVHDFSFAFNEPMTDMYFWHPSFDDFPVVGITKKQAEAYLAWKSTQEQKKLNAEGKGDWIIQYELPTECQWEMVETANTMEGQPVIYPATFNYVSDYGYMTDLALKPGKLVPLLFHGSREYLNKDSIWNGMGGKFELSRYTIIPNRNSLFYTWNTRKDAMDNEFTKESAGLSARRKLELHRKFYDDYQVVQADFLKNNSITKKLPFMQSNYDCNGISFMGSNVSEWLQDTYTDNYKPLYNYRHNLLEKIGGKDITFQLALEDYYDATNDSDCHVIETYASLVRGSNWYDDREGGLNGKNTEGMNAKKFVSPDSAYSTLGFRYIIILKRRDEQKSD